MTAYEYPYLSAHQTITEPPTPWQQELADALEAIFANGHHQLDEVVAGLNQSGVRPPSGGDWSADNFTALMGELGT